MIALVTGRLAAKDTGGTVVVDTGSVGYRIFVSLNTLMDLPDTGRELSLFTVTVVRDDAFHLYGFSSTEERDLFNLLVQVKGIGPQVALALLGGLKPGDLKEAITRQDAAWISTVPGVGRKTAERIVLELRDKVSGPPVGSPDRVQGVSDEVIKDVVSALTNLGYRAAEGGKAVREVLEKEGSPDDFQGLVRECLKLLSGRKT
jgi:Holliday junction DNA helicase RuvA